MVEPPQAISALSIGDDAPCIVNAVIEIPKGSATKYEYREDLDRLCIDEGNRSPLPFPADYGFIPHARSQDGDLLDIFVLGSDPRSTGTVVRVRPIGMLDMADDRGQDSKIVGIAVDDEELHCIADIQDVADGVRKAIETFLCAYKRQNGGSLHLQGWHGRERAHAAITAAHSAYVRMSGTVA